MSFGHADDERFEIECLLMGGVEFEAAVEVIEGFPPVPEEGVATGEVEMRSCFVGLLDENLVEASNGFMQIAIAQVENGRVELLEFLEVFVDTQLKILLNAFLNLIEDRVGDWRVG